MVEPCKLWDKLPSPQVGSVPDFSTINSIEFYPEINQVCLDPREIRL